MLKIVSSDGSVTIEGDGSIAQIMEDLTLAIHGAIVKFTYILDNRDFDEILDVIVGAVKDIKSNAYEVKSYTEERGGNRVLH